MNAILFSFRRFLGSQVWTKLVDLRPVYTVEYSIVHGIYHSTPKVRPCKREIQWIFGSTISI
jgi:hypothetical protein